MSVTDPFADARERLKIVWPAIWQVVFVVVFNLLLYILVYQAAQYNLVNSNSSFPPLVLFLSFALSVGIVLIVGLGEKIDTDKIENKWIKMIGVGPIMVIVAALISTLGAFSGLGGLIFPNVDQSKLKFMLANVGVTCSASDPRNSPQATNLLAVISSTDANYIKDVREYLEKDLKENRSLIYKVAEDEHLTFVKPGDEFHQILFQQAFTEDLNDKNKWIAYSVEIKDPRLITSIPVPTEYDRNHKTRFFVIVAQPPETSEVTVLNVSASPVSARTSIKSLFQVEIVPMKPEETSQLTELNVRVSADHVCWHAAGGAR